MGMSRQYKTPEEMQRIIDLYFMACRVHMTDNETILEGLPEEDLLLINDIDDIYPTVTGLAYALDLTRMGLINYEGREEFVDTVKKAKLRVEKHLEQRLAGANVAGTIFNLKNNFGWRDIQHVEEKSERKIQTQIVFQPAELDEAD